MRIPCHRQVSVTRSRSPSFVSLSEGVKCKIASRPQERAISQSEMSRARSRSAAEAASCARAREEPAHGTGTTSKSFRRLRQAVEYDVLPTCRRHGMGVLTYSPLAGGWLTGRYRKGRAIAGSGSAVRTQRFAHVLDATLPANAAKLDAADALGALAEEAGMTLIQMAIAFVTRHPAVTSAIVGPRTMEHLESYLAAAAIDLPSDVIASTGSFPPGTRSTSPTTCGARRPRRWTPPPGAARSRVVRKAAA